MLWMAHSSLALAGSSYPLTCKPQPRGGVVQHSLSSPCPASCFHYPGFRKSKASCAVCCLGCVCPGSEVRDQKAGLLMDRDGLFCFCVLGWCLLAAACPGGLEFRGCPVCTHRGCRQKCCVSALLCMGISWLSVMPFES